MFYTMYTKSDDGQLNTIKVLWWMVDSVMCLLSTTFTKDVIFL
jgi:hypothetical protein